MLTRPRGAAVPREDARKPVCILAAAIVLGITVGGGVERQLNCHLREILGQNAGADRMVTFGPTIREGVIATAMTPSLSRVLIVLR